MSAVELGATLYVPAINGAARAMAYGSIPDLRSMVVCLEDAIRDDQVPQAVEGLSSLLMELAGKPSDLMIYVRPRTQIGRESGRERVCQNAEISVGDGSLKKKQ